MGDLMTAAIEQGERLAGRYRLEEQVGGSGMGWYDLCYRRRGVGRAVAKAGSVMTMASRGADPESSPPKAARHRRSRRSDTDQAAAAPAHEDGATLLQGRYVLQRVIGRGNLATVYWATDSTLERSVALKLLHPHICREAGFVEEFLDMERRIARLFHPHLVTIFDAGTSEDGCFVVMEYVTGGNLRERLGRGDPVALSDVVKIVSQVADALQLLHLEQLVHGDITPENVLLDENGDAKLVDFGIAHLAATTGALHAQSVGSAAAYLAPEQLEHGPADARSDVYSLGVVTYELLTGRAPFEGEDWVAAATERLSRDPERPSLHRPALSPELDGVVLRALAREPRERFQSAAEFRIALQRARAESSPRLASGPLDRWAADRPRRWARQLRGQSWARLAPVGAALLVGLLVLGLVLPPLLNPSRLVQVPDLAGQTVDAARRALREAGLGLRTTDEVSESAPKGIVLRQEPPARANTQSDQLVRIFVSSGPPPVAAPDLQSRRLEDARADLDALGLRLGKVDEREVARQPWGVVVAQSARPRSDLARGGTVDVTLGMPPWTTAPPLVDKAIGEAEAELEKRGLKLSGVRPEPVPGKRAGTVLAQDPVPDVRLRQGQSVSLVVAVPPPQP
ncbi:MAG: protein kinase [Chloroflexi bacterium]|nr:protein kinase [Chloroflexota bacterium]